MQASIFFIYRGYKTWKQDAALPFPIVYLKGDAEKVRAAWGAGALPWLTLTNKAHRATAEGFTIKELDARIKHVEEQPWFSISAARFILLRGKTTRRLANYCCIPVDIAGGLLHKCRWRDTRCA
jgi:hypothetical protein